MRGGVALLLAAWVGCAHAQAPAVLDTDHLPPMRAPGPQGYREHFIIGNLPRAWAIASDGSYGGEWGSGTIEKIRDAALKRCAAKGGTDCAIYAENLDVVWRGQTRRVTLAPITPLVVDRGYAIVPDARFIWHGPQSAAGIIVWGHGYGGPETDSRGNQPPAFLRPLNNAGFDVVRFDRDPTWDHDIDRVVGWLRDGLRTLRRRGWRKIVAAGQSRGAWNCLAILDTPGLPDVVITASLAASGTIPGNRILRGETMFYTLADDVKRQTARLAFLQFKDVPYADDMDQRARRVKTMIAPKLDAVLLIDRPDGFSEHSGAYLVAFAEKFGNCILHFVTDAKPPATCP